MTSIYNTIYFNKDIIYNLKSELRELNNGEIVFIHDNKITFATNNDKYNNEEHIMKYNVINDNIQNNEPYSDELYFSYYDSETNNIYNNEFIRSEVMYLTFTIDIENNIINCICSITEVDPYSIMYDQLAKGTMTFQKIDNTFTYLSGCCEDRAGDGYGISSYTIIEVLHIISKYWNIK